ncbi:MAG: right-handed parallel beta-helix repeat-containing protein [Actinomycetota bacterium]|nr:right-handed parallel beta-helix repeat-containing protein [Actinomycetota bacterium]
MRGSRTLLGLAATALVALALPALALAHIERPSYWPDPAADTSIQPATGGKVPKARPLSTALKDRLPGDTRVVCQKNSLTLLKQSVRRARKNGYHYRPTEKLSLSAKRAQRLVAINERLFKRCRFKHIQPAVHASGNNDRVVVMPGIYTEPHSRAQKTHDPACDKYERNNEFGDPGALSYEYHLNCPNDQNLIAVMGREKGSAPAPDPPRFDRHGIPDLGPCVRCNLQIEGSGVSADDVVIEAGDPKQGNKGPAKGAKDVGIRADRADGFVLRMITARHANEHGIYVLESDGYLLDRFKAFYNGLYGTLTFVEDHGVQQHCETAGHADSGIYPGAAVESGMQRPEGAPLRYNQEIRYCDSYHNLAGYSGTNGNAVHIHHNNFYGNALGVQTDIATSPGHPGHPGDTMLVEHNNIYSNNFNPYEPGSDVEAAFPFPVGTGLWIAGGNHHTIRNNNIYDNHRRGTMIFAIPDVLICGEQTNNHEQKGCEQDKVNTSFFNANASNVMGRAPDGTSKPNGTDFWWDEFAGNQGNCWYLNDGPQRLVYNPPPRLPSCNDGKNPEQSMGDGDEPNEAELFSCLAAFETRNFEQETTTCPWLFTPPKPKATAEEREIEVAKERVRAQEIGARFCAETPDANTCRAYLSPPSLR